MTNLDKLYDIDDRAKAFENHQIGLLVSLAGPGTGKTYSLLTHINALIEQGIDPNSICYLTFIKEISNAFVSEYIEKFGLDFYNSNIPRISTLHSFACRLLRNQGFQLGYDGELFFTSISDSEDRCSDIFIQDLLPLISSNAIQTPAQLRKILSEIKVAWQNETNQSRLEESFSNLFPDILKLLKCYRLIDWDQVINVANSLINGKKELPTWISRIKYYLVDEYQDFNKAEQSFLSNIFSSAKSIIIVGDDNQSLYSGRGGSPDGIRNLFHSDECDQVTLIRCRRCKSKIVDAANTFMSAIKTDIEPMLSLNDGGVVNCYSFKSTKSEIKYLVNFLSAKIKSLPENPCSKDGIICLFPSRRVLDFYFDHLSKYISCCKRKTCPSPNRLWLQKSLELACRPNQRFIERILQEEYESIKPRHKKEIVKLMLQNDISSAEALEILIQENELKGDVAFETFEFCNFCHALSTQSIEPITEKFHDRLGIEIDYLVPRLELFFQDDAEIDQEEKISRLCDELIPDSISTPETPDSVLFLTMHSSKGLTKKTVVIPGLEKAWLPGDAHGSDLDERMRQFYVSITRATDHVLITYPLRRARGDPLNYEAPGRGEVSPFVVMSNIPCEYHG